MVSNAEKFSTISVPVDVKAILQEAKGDLEWGPFLLSLYMNCSKLRSEKAYKELKQLLSGEDLSEIELSSKEFRKSFKLRERS